MSQTEFPPLTQKEVLRVFLPLTLNLGFITISIPFIHWALSLYRDSELVLSIFSFCFAVCIVNHSVVLGCSRVVASLLDSYANYKRLRLFTFSLALIPFSIYVILSFTSLGLEGLRWIFRLPEGNEQHVQNFFKMMILAPFCVANRLFLEGICIKAKYTRPVGESTLIRLIFSVLLCYILGKYTNLSVGYLGGITLAGGILTEAIWIFSRTRKLIPSVPFSESAPLLSFKTILSSWFPLYLSSLAWTISYPLINRLIIENNSNDKNLLEAELAGFGVLRSLLLTIAGPVYAVTNTTLSIYRQPEDLKIIRRFGIRFCLFISIFSSLFFIPSFRTLILQSVFHLTPFTIGISILGVSSIPFYPWFTIFRSLDEGRLLKLKFFRIFLATSFFRLLTIYLAGKLCIGLQWPISGVTLGGICLFVGATSDWFIISFCAYYFRHRALPS